MRFKLIVLGAIALGSLAFQAPASAGECSDLLPGLGAGAAGRPISARDLVALRDIGPKSASDPIAPILSISPDGTRVAFQLHRADIETNAYCLGLIVVDLNRPRVPQLVDQGGELVRETQDLLAVTGYPTGYTKVITPKWSPDGRALAFLRRDKGLTQVWLAQSDGSGSRALTQLPSDAEDFAWTPDGRGIVISWRPALAAAFAAIDAEGRSGFLYDDRFMPFTGAHRPFTPAPIKSAFLYLDIESGLERAANPDEVAILGGGDAGRPAGAERVAYGPAGQVAWLARRVPGNVSSEQVLHVTHKGGRDIECLCRDEVAIADMWWSYDGQDLIFLREDWHHSRAAIYVWRPGKGSPRQLLQTDDALIGCRRALARLVCAQEGSVQPRRLVSIDLVAGRSDVLFDPNPRFQTLALGKVQRFSWHNKAGSEQFFDLILPLGHHAGQKHPLVIVQYETRGFLRGGTDDEYPIQLLAANGFAVLSFQFPRNVGLEQGGKTWDEINRIDHTDWALRRNVQAVLEHDIDIAVATGTIDRTRIGITGLSEGANMVQFAIVNSHLFAAAAMSGCCEEATSLMSLSGSAGAAFMHRIGYPRLDDDGTSFWAPYSIRANADRLTTPILIQAADSEYLMAAETVEALREKNKPVEMYVFPNEFHEKWQPQHRLAVYERNVDWFNFWLRQVEDPAPAKRDQYRRWEALKANALSVSAMAK